MLKVSGDEFAENGEMATGTVKMKRAKEVEGGQEGGGFLAVF